MAVICLASPGAGPPKQYYSTKIKNKKLVLDYQCTKVKLVRRKKTIFGTVLLMFTYEEKYNHLHFIFSLHILTMIVMTFTPSPSARPTQGPSEVQLTPTLHLVPHSSQVLLDPRSTCPTLNRSTQLLMSKWFIVLFLEGYHFITIFQ